MDISLLLHILMPKDESFTDVTPREELILYTLYDKELYGLQIPQAIQDASCGHHKLSIGTLYPALHSLEAKKLIESRWGDEGRLERGGARRRYYKLTPQGVNTFEQLQLFRANLIAWKP